MLELCRPLHSGQRRSEVALLRAPIEERICPRQVFRYRRFLDHVLLTGLDNRVDGLPRVRFALGVVFGKLKQHIAIRAKLILADRIDGPAGADHFGEQIKHSLIVEPRLWGPFGALQVKIVSAPEQEIERSDSSCGRPGNPGIAVEVSPAKSGSRGANFVVAATQLGGIDAMRLYSRSKNGSAELIEALKIIPGRAPQPKAPRRLHPW